MNDMEKVIYNSDILYKYEIWRSRDKRFQHSIFKKEVILLLVVVDLTCINLPRVLTYLISAIRVLFGAHYSQK